jgi:WD40 repeat protein
MVAPHTLRIFISYARRDGASLAQHLQSDLAQEGFDAWLDTQRIAGGALWSTAIEREVDTRQVMIALLSPGSYISEICRAEQIRALDKGNRVIPVLAVQGADRPIYLSTRQYRDLTSDAAYATHFPELLADIRGDATAILPTSYRKTRITYLTAPPRVANYLDRPEALGALREILFAEDHRHPIVLTALAGMGGIGKTVLAKALVDDEVVQRAFPDGIAWITAGKERNRDFIQEMREVAKALGDDLSTYDNALACENQYRTTIAGKAALIVVDDVWSTLDIQPLLAESPRSRFLFTTRDASIGRFVGARECYAHLLDREQSRELLASWSDCPAAELPPAADGVISECGGLPLALSVIGAMLRGADNEFWDDTLVLLRNADLSAIQTQLPTGQESFFRAVEVSFNALSPEMQECYKALAVLPEDMAAPLPILRTLWAASDAEARRIRRHFVDRSLAQSAGEPGAIRLHDLQLDYVRAQSPFRNSLPLISSALRLSGNIIECDPSQFAGQLRGRLLPYSANASLSNFIASITKGAPRPWLCPMNLGLISPGGPLVRTLDGHSGAVTGVALTANGRRAVSCSEDGTVRIWDLDVGREIRKMDGPGPITQLALCADGRVAISASEDNTLAVWDLEGIGKIRTLTSYPYFVSEVALSADGRRALSACGNRVTVWDVKAGREVYTLAGHRWGDLKLGISADGQLAISSSTDVVKVWDLNTGRELFAIPNGESAESDEARNVHDVALSADGRYAVLAYYDQLQLWDLNIQRQIRAVPARLPRSIALNVDARSVIGVSNEDQRSLRVWYLATERETRIYRGHFDAIRSVALSTDGRHAITASADRTIKSWDLDQSRELRPADGHDEDVTVLAVSANGRRAFSVSKEMMKIWDLDTRKELSSHPDYLVNGVALTADGHRAASVRSNELSVWDVDAGRRVRTVDVGCLVAKAIAITSDARQAISVSVYALQDKLTFWNLDTGEELRTIVGDYGLIDKLALSADGRRAISAASMDPILHVWNLNAGEVERTLRGHTKPVNGLALSADGRYAVSASGDGTLGVWDLNTGQLLRTLTGHVDSVTDVALSSDERYAISASADHTLKLWNLEAGTVLATFTCDAAVSSVAFRGPRIIGGDRLGRVHFLTPVFPLDNAEDSDLWHVDRCLNAA